MPYKPLFYLLLTALFVVGSIWLTDKMQYKRQLSEKAENVKELQDKLSKCTSNSIVFDKKVKKSDLNLRQFFSNPLSFGDLGAKCHTDTVAIVTWWDDLKPRERRKYRREILENHP